MMLGSLEEVSTNLNTLLQDLQQLQKKLVSPIKAKKENRQSFLIKIPKVILILKICPFLNQHQIAQLSSTCIGLRRVIYSPIGWKLLSRVITPYPLIIKEIFVSDNFEENKLNLLNQTDTFPIHMIEDEKLLKKARGECKKSLMQVYDKYKAKEEEHNALNKRLKCEKTHLKKLKMYKDFLQSHKQSLQVGNIEYKTQLKAVNQGFSQRIQVLEGENQELLKQTTKLQNQKEALVGKIREYQNEIEVIKSESEKSKQILKKIKNYLLYKEL